MAEETKNETKVEDPRTLKQLQEELTEREFVGAELLTSKAAALAVLANIDKQNKVSKVKLSDPSNVKDDEVQDRKRWFGKAQKMKEFLDSLPKVDFIIPLGINEKQGAVETWQANGYKLSMLKGMRIKIPSKVADDLADAYQLTAAAGEQFSLDRPATDPKSPFSTVREALE